MLFNSVTSLVKLNYVRIGGVQSWSAAVPLDIEMSATGHKPGLKIRFASTGLDAYNSAFRPCPGKGRGEASIDRASAFEINNQNDFRSFPNSLGAFLATL
jgi:hypothetical protein